MPCPICLSSDIITHRILYDDRFGFDGHFTLLKCNFCDHKFLDNITDDFLNLIYENYYYRNNLDSIDIKKIKEKNNLFLWLTGNYYFAYRWVPKDVRVLDIGCGFGEALIYHKNRGCEVFGVETGGESIKNLSDKYGLNIKIGFFDPNLYPENYFDYITMDQVIEHIKNPLETLKGIRRILKPTGKVIISTPNPDGWGAAVFKNKYWNWHIPYHINQFSILSMKVLAGLI